MRIEIDGRPVTAESLWETASAYGHFTAMQVRGTRYYSTVLDELEGEEGASRELFFTHCGGKARMPMVIRALRALDVPVAAIADLDEEGRVRAIVEALGRGWTTFERDWRIVNSAIAEMAAAPEIVASQQLANEAFQEAAASGPRLTANGKPKDPRGNESRRRLGDAEATGDRCGATR